MVKHLHDVLSYDHAPFEEISTRSVYSVNNHHVGFRLLKQNSMHEIHYRQR